MLIKNKKIIIMVLSMVVLIGTTVPTMAATQYKYTIKRSHSVFTSSYVKTTYRWKATNTSSTKKINSSSGTSTYSGVFVSIAKDPSKLETSTKKTHYWQSYPKFTFGVADTALGDIGFTKTWADTTTLSYKGTASTEWDD